MANPSQASGDKDWTPEPKRALPVIKPEVARPEPTRPTGWSPTAWRKKNA